MLTPGCVNKTNSRQSCISTTKKSTNRHTFLGHPAVTLLHPQTLISFNLGHFPAPPSPSLPSSPSPYTHALTIKSSTFLHQPTSNSLSSFPQLTLNPALPPPIILNAS